LRGINGLGARPTAGILGGFIIGILTGLGIDNRGVDLGIETETDGILIAITLTP